MPTGAVPTDSIDTCYIEALKVLKTPSLSKKDDVKHAIVRTAHGCKWKAKAM